jgi:hypothetical protein
MSEIPDTMPNYFPAGGEGGSHADSRKWAQQNIVGRKIKRTAVKSVAATPRKSKTRPKAK